MALIGTFAVLVAVLLIRQQPWGRGGKGEGMAYSNRLIHEKSPYLLQHAHNPVDWYPWGEEAFARARRENKPIFLSVGYSTCHWCHVMERESFESEEIAQLLNEHFVSIKVDREERPDIDEVYMSAVQAITGRGGWPLSAFLTPEGRPFYGGTYFPREQFARVLTRVARMFGEDRAKVEQAADETARAIESMVRVPAAELGSRLARGLVRQALEVLQRQFDAEHGGFGTAPKFPPHTALPLLLYEHRRNSGEGLLDMARLTLDQMAMGGIHDHIGGGFHRYATDERWFLPHFEKMLYDNALMARNYVEAYAVTGDEFYREVATGIYDWVEREMTGPEGGFYSALDADSEGIEGKFYVWTQQEIIDVLGEDEGELFCAAYGTEREGNYAEEATREPTGRNIPYLGRRLSDFAKQRGMEPAAVEAQMAAARKKLLAARSRRVRPARDDKVLTAWNGLMIGSLAYAGRELGEPGYTETAARAARFVLDNLRRDGRLLRRWREGEARFPGYLDDSVFLAQGLLDIHAATGEQEWLDEARGIVEAAIGDFWDDSGGGFFATAAESERILVRVKQALDHPLPSSNGAAALVLLRLAEATGEDRYRTYAGRTLEAMLPWMQRAPFGTDTLMLAAAIYLDEAQATASTKAGSAAKSPPVVAEKPTAKPAPVVGEKGPVKLAASLSNARVAPGERFEVVCRLEMAKGWHVNSHSPRQAYLIPISMIVKGTVPLEVGEIAYPSGREIDQGGERLSVYSGQVEISVPITVGTEAAEGESQLSVSLGFQACDDTSCLAPERIEVKLPIVVESPK